ncbi:MAG: metallophosphoesterase [Clostridiales bacterium]|nr:metallophosphoesterase [Clostridiales bacterium]
MKKIIRFVVKLIFAAFLLALLYKAAFSEKIKVREYNIASEKADEDIKLLLITDLHCTLYGENQSELIEKIDEINPRAILLGGDFYDEYRTDENSDMLLQNIGSRYECYYVSGNHEYWSSKNDTAKEKAENCGITVLEGDSDDIGENITLWGIDDFDCGEYTSGENWYDELEACASGADPNKFNILLSHRPERTEDYKNSSFDLVLSGHAHGGQWRLPFVLNGVYAPNQGLFPKYAGGEYDLDGCIMIVSRGLALSDTPRIFNPPELVVINIEKP